MVRKFILATALLFGSSQFALADDKSDDIGFSVNLNSALLAVIQHGKAALGNTGCIIIDSFFNNDLKVSMADMETYEYTKWWYTEHHNGREAIQRGCKEAKQEFYLKKIDWKADPAFDYYFQRKEALDSAVYYIGHGSKKNRFNWNQVDFSCTDNQRLIFMRAKLLGEFGYLKYEDQPDVVYKAGLGFLNVAYTTRPKKEDQQ